MCVVLLWRSEELGMEVGVVCLWLSLEARCRCAEGLVCNEPMKVGGV